MGRPTVAIDCRLMQYRRAGISQYTRGLAIALAGLPKRDFNLALLLDRRDRDTGWVPGDVTTHRVVTPAHHRLETWMWPLELAARFPRLALLHSPDFIAPAGCFRKVITLHDLYFAEHPEVMSADGARYYGRTPGSVARADRIIAVSAHTAADIGRLIGPAAAAKTVVVHEAGAIPVRAARSEDAIQPYVLFVGTFEPRKNLDTLLRALARPEAAGVNLVVVGEPGWGTGGPARLAKQLGVAGRVRFAGRVDDAELDTLYASARGFAMPSLSEGFGLPVIEAMTRGVPVICAAAGALPEIAGDAALMHAPIDEVALAAHAGAVWADPGLRADYARRGLAQAARFTWARAARETAAVYRAALGLA
ncbi:MAG: glycosyltransferase family 1 protein [Thermoflexales bacterium]